MLTRYISIPVPSMDTTVSLDTKFTDTQASMFSVQHLSSFPPNPGSSTWFIPFVTSPYKRHRRVKQSSTATVSHIPIPPHVLFLAHRKICYQLHCLISNDFLPCLRLLASHFTPSSPSSPSTGKTRSVP
jgi:hypothetical protein